MLETLKKPFSGRAIDWAFGLAAAMAAAAVVFTFAHTWIPGYGLTRMIPIGREFNRRGTAAYRAVPKYIDPYPQNRWGFDGQFYAELSLDPLLRDPGLRTALDNPPYRAHRILLPWLAWLGGLGHPRWVLNVYAALNGVFWLGYAAILIALFRPHGWAGVAGFAAMLLTCGVVESMHESLTDFPAFVLLTLAAMAGGMRSGALLALSGLAREVNLLGYLGLVDFKRPWGESLKRNLAIGFVAGLPFVLWYAYVAWRLPMRTSMVGGNLDWPLHAIALRLREVLASARQGGLRLEDVLRRGSEMHALLTIVAILTQCVYVLTHPRFENRVWRVGAVFVPFFLCISSVVWGGYSYFTVTRHALPITLAFNLVLAMRPSRAWLAWFLLGNCFVPAGVHDLVHFGNLAPAHADYAVEAPPVIDQHVAVRYEAGWSAKEWTTGRAWRWATGRTADLVLANSSGRKLEARLVFRTLSLTPRELKVVAGADTVWLGELDPKPASPWVRTLKFPLPEGRTRVEFSSRQPPAPPGPDDTRTLSFMITGLIVEAGP